MIKSFKIKNIGFGPKYPLALIAGPCVIESKLKTFNIAKKLIELTKKRNIPFIFKASYDKANRTSLDSFRGPGLIKGIEILSEIRKNFNVPILTDAHSIEEVKFLKGKVDIIQIPAFLSRQTDLLIEAGKTGCLINIKKAQFMSPHDIIHVIKKIESTGNKKILITERGTSFGYNTLITDMRNLIIMREFGYPIIFDATHSVQSPGGAGKTSSGDGKFAPYLAKAATAIGIDGLFIETHIKPSSAKSDGPNMIPFSEMNRLLKKLKNIDSIK